MTEKDNFLTTYLRLKEDKSTPRPGEIYVHYKGGEYEVLAVGLDEVTHEPRIMYRSFDGAYVADRLLSVFQEIINVEGHMRPRFEKFDHTKHFQGEEL